MLILFEDDDDVVPFEIKEQRAIEVLPAPKEGRRQPHIFNVDHVLWNCSQLKAFEVIALPTVQDILRGFNGNSLLFIFLSIFLFSENYTQ